MTQIRILWALVLCVSLFQTFAFAQADDVVYKIIEITESAQTQEEYENGKKLIGPLKDQLTCDSLSRISDEHLLIFYEDIFRLNSEFLRNCRDNLLKRIDSFLAAKNLALKVSRPKLSPCRANTARTPTQTLGPSLEISLDNSRAKTITDGALPECHISLTFDDGPHSTLTPQLLTTLKQENVRVNFFVLGQNVQYYPKPLVAAAAAGHVIGNHSMSHANLSKLEHKAAQLEIAKGFKAIFAIFGEYVPFFRFPYGASTRALKNYAYQNRWLDFFWTMDSLDWKIKDPEILYRKVLDELEREKKGVLLFHDIHPQTIVIVPYVLSALNEAGYTSVIFTSTEVLKSAPNQTTF